MSKSSVVDSELEWQWVRDSRWFSSHEGPYTVFAKLSIANALNRDDVTAGLGVTLLKSNPVQLHARSFLNTNWACPSSPAYAELLVEIERRTLAARYPRWWRCFASDLSLRYCPACIAQGFQSALCQIEGLAICPVHQVSIVDRCLHCNERTPRYALTEELLLAPLTCPGCEVEYGVAWAPANHFRGWAAPEVLAYETLGSELQQIERLAITWPDQCTWLLDPADPRSDAKRRARTFELLTTFIPSSVVPPSKQLDLRRYALLKSDLPWNLEQIDHAAAVRTKIYKSIRRHYRRLYKAQASRAHALREELIWDYPHAVLLPGSAHVSAQLHGFLSWRTRFESDRLWGEITTGRANDLNLRYGMVGWPSRWRATDAAWADFCLACLKHELMAAEEFHAQLGKLDIRDASTRSEWMALASRLHHRFGPMSRRWPAGITCFVVSASTDAATAHIELVLVSASTGEEVAVKCVGHAESDSRVASADR